MDAKHRIVVIGLGPGKLNQMTLEAWDLINSTGKLILRTQDHPAAKELAQRGLFFETCDEFYKTSSNFDAVYSEITRYLIDEAKSIAFDSAPLVYAVPGHPLIAEKSVALLIEQARAESIYVDIISAMSFWDPAVTDLNIDPLINGMALLDALDPPDIVPTQLGCLYAQVYSQLAASELKVMLLEHYPPEHTVTLIKSAGIVEDRQKTDLPLYLLDRDTAFDHLTSLYVPPLSSPCMAISAPNYPLDPLTDVMARLLSPDGCPWDKEQTFETMKEPLLNEAYEVIEALDLKDMFKLREELGDLLLQIVFNTALAMQQDAFDYNDVIADITEKMVRRHPHVFGDTVASTSNEVLTQWELIKAKEKEQVADKVERVMDGLNTSLPSLLYAYEVQRKAKKKGFDWKDISGPLDKITEEIEELKLAITQGVGVDEEFGDTLFSLVNLSRFLNLSPEAALMNASQKFIRRFNQLEDIIIKNGYKWEDMNLNILDKWWEEVKKAEKP